ncbi:MAG TPA: MOSC domain-containing protein [Polyangiales bacterium]
MRTLAELQQLYAERPVPPRGEGRVDLLVLRSAPGKHLTPTAAELTPQYGLVGDRWAKGWTLRRDVDRQVTLMMTAVAELVCDGQPLHLPGDNLLVNLDLGAEALPIGSRLRAGAVLLEVSKKPHLGCKKFVARFGQDALDWVNDEQGRARNLRGVNCRILEAGTLRVGDGIEVVARSGHQR